MANTDFDKEKNDYDNNYDNKNNTYDKNTLTDNKKSSKSSNNTEKNIKRNFFTDMYDDFFYLISSNPEIFDKQRQTQEDNTLSKNNSTQNKIPKIEIPKTESKNYSLSTNTNANTNTNTNANLNSNTFSSTSSNRDANITTDTTTITTTNKNSDTATLSQEELLAQEEERKFRINDFYYRIDNSHLSDDSKIVLKKMIDYARKFDEKIVNKYIPFNMRIYCDNDEFLFEVVNIIVDSFTFFHYMKNDEAIQRSFFVVEDSSNITELYSPKNSLIVFKDVHGLLNQDKSTRDKILSIWESTIIYYSNLNGITTIISDTNKEKIDSIFMTNKSLKDKIFDYELSTIPPDSQEIYQSILNNLKEDYILTAEFEIKLLDYINETYPKTTLSSPEYISSTIERIMFNKTEEIIGDNTIPEFEKNKSIDEIFKDLNDLVGLDNVKKMLKDLVDLIEFKKKSGSYLKIKDTNLHMVFLGNPGTGKTTVARMVAGILYNLDYIEQNKLIEVSAKDLIGQYVGQTAPKTMEVIESALGGVLFIDEAYSLATKPGQASTFNEECIATLIQAMENYRDNLVVIFAGYTKEMDAFLKSNSGIISRIGYTLEFKDYTVDELIKILKSMFEKSGFIVDNLALDKSREIIEKYRHTEGFGNARFVRNLYEKSIINHASNTKNVTSKKVLKTIVPEDITDENISKL